MLDLGAALAARESAMAQKRVQRGVDAIAVAGKPPGGGLYGYRSTYPDGPGRRPVRVIDDTPAPVVREIIDRVLAGETLSAIARDLDERGVPTPRKPLRRDVGTWRPGVVRAIAANPAYAAIRTHNGKVMEKAAPWPPLVSAATHRKVMALLSDADELARMDAALVAVREAQAGRRATLERRQRPAHVPAVLLELAGRPDAVELWVNLSTADRRVVIAFLVDVKVLETTRRGPGSFDPTSVAVTPKVGGRS